MSEVRDPSEVVVEVDATGLSCPLPVIELAKAVGGIAVGQSVRLLATDPAAKVDVPVWCRMQRHELRGQAQQDRVWIFEVQKAH
ncbi:MAG TPA: sulfurtransferase TusA family protein [Egicoccus sp.]|nr:sulfurtransferase TusA family protein [Egicoccus sp.]HSK24408.1 sulfurtransferase TusA family protein [Egicoccus sp.]